MSFKTLLLTAISASVFGTLSAQDNLYKKNGDLMEVKIMEVNARTVSFKKTSNPDGPLYTINKGEVAKITYENGAEDVFGEVGTAKTRSSKKSHTYGNNIISFIPMEITSGVGIGLSYERAIDKENVLSFYMPVTMAFNDNNPTGTGTSTPSAPPTYYIMPGLKFYPTGGKGIIRYGVGPNLAYVTGSRYSGGELIYDNNGNIIGQTPSGWKSRSALGIMVTNSLNINPNAHLHLGLELGIGFTYFNKLGGTNLNTDALGQFGFKIGYRF